MKCTRSIPGVGAATLRDWLVREGDPIGRTLIPTLMRRMSITAIYCKPKARLRNRDHTVY